MCQTHIRHDQRVSYVETTVMAHVRMKRGTLYESGRSNFKRHDALIEVGIA